MTDEETANAYRRAQAQTLLDVFEFTNGNPAGSMDELAQWAASQEGKDALSPHRKPDGKMKANLPAIEPKSVPPLRLGRLGGSGSTLHEVERTILTDSF